MPEVITPFPLCWPPRKKRAAYRKDGSFQRTASEAKALIEDELGRMNVDSFLVSTNARSLRDNPADPAVAAWFLYKGEWRCVAVDAYTTVRANLCACANTIEALRTVGRHGGMEIFKQAIQGFAAFALPAPEAWHQILGATETASEDQIRTAHRALAARNHPDRGGSTDEMARINTARDEGLRARSGV